MRPLSRSKNLISAQGAGTPNDGFPLNALKTILGYPEYF